MNKDDVIHTHTHTHTHTQRNTTYYSGIKRINYQGIYLTKEMKDLYSENYKTLVKDTEDNTK